MGEEEAINLLESPSGSLKNPGIKYIAATRLGACVSEDSMNALVKASLGDRENIFDKITRRKAIEALGRRKNPQFCPSYLNLSIAVMSRQ